MTQQAQNEVTEEAAAETPAGLLAADTPNEEQTLEDRIASVKAKLETGEKSDPKADPKAAAKPAEPGEEDKRREERRARLEKLATETRAKADKSHEQRKHRETEKQKETELETLRRRVVELEALESATKDEASYIEYAAKKNYDPTKLGEYIRSRLTNPELVAERKVQSALSPLEQRLKELQDATERRIQEVEQREQRLRTEQEQRETASTFVAQVRSSERTAPLTAAFLDRHGEQGLIAFANQLIVPLLPETATLTDLHDAIEQFLDDVQPRKAAQATTSNGTKKTPNGTATPKTLTNDLASQRASVTEEEDLSDLPLEERVARVKERLAREERNSA